MKKENCSGKQNSQNVNSLSTIDKIVDCEEVPERHFQAEKT